MKYLMLYKTINQTFNIKKTIFVLRERREDGEGAYQGHKSF